MLCAVFVRDKLSVWTFWFIFYLLTQNPVAKQSQQSSRKSYNQIGDLSDGLINFSLKLNMKMSPCLFAALLSFSTKSEISKERRRVSGSPDKSLNKTSCLRLLRPGNHAGSLRDSSYFRAAAAPPLT